MSALGQLGPGGHNVTTGGLAQDLPVRRRPPDRVKVADCRHSRADLAPLAAFIIAAMLVFGALGLVDLLPSRPVRGLGRWVFLAHDESQFALQLQI